MLNRRSVALWSLFSLTIFFLSTYAYGANPASRMKRVTKKARRSAPMLSWSQKPTAPPPPAVSMEPISEAVPRRFVNFRWHPFYQMQMLADKETIAAARVDMDLLVSDHFSFGPSFFFRNSRVFDSSVNLIDENMMQLGLLTNFYLTETSSQGGLILRPHAYWLNVDAKQTTSTGAQSDSDTTTNGARVGLELVYQKILNCGLNFEVGGGFTYHIIPYAVNFPDGGSLQPNPALAPTFSLAVGWAF